MKCEGCSKWFFPSELKDGFAWNEKNRCPACCDKSWKDRLERQEQGHQERIKKILKRGGTVPKKPTRVDMIKSWVKLNEWMAKKEPLSPHSKTYPDGLIKFEVKECNTCRKVDVVQHQGTCVECMAEYAYSDKLINEELKGTCQMCGKNLSKNEQNPCKHCCKMAMGDNEEDRRENYEAVIEHCKEITGVNNHE